MTMKKNEAMPLSSLFVARRKEPVTPFDPAKGGVVVDLVDTTMKRLRFELSLPTANLGLLQAVEDEHERCAEEFATRQLKQSSANTAGGRALKKRPDVTRAVLETFREEYVIGNEHERGWKKAAMRAFSIDSVNTINARLKKKE